MLGDVLHAAAGAAAARRVVAPPVADHRVGPALCERRQ
jgi:hypothetical protein